MKIIFGTPTCPACKRLKKQLENDKEQFLYYDLGTPDGLMEAAMRGLINKCEKSLPVIIEE